MAASEIDKMGKVLWAREFATLITSISVGRRESIWGLLDGGITILDEKGSLLPYNLELQNLRFFAPDNACSYGVGISPNGDSILVLYGNDPQYLAAFTKVKNGYKLTATTKLKKNVATSSQAVFTDDGLSALARSGEGLIHFDAEHSRFSRATKESTVDDARISLWNNNGFAVLAQSPAETSALLVRTGLKVAKIPLVDTVYRISAEGTKIETTTDKGIARMECGFR